MRLVISRALGGLQDELPAGGRGIAHLQLERLQLLDFFSDLKQNKFISWTWKINRVSNSYALKISCHSGGLAEQNDEVGGNNVNETRVVRVSVLYKN